MNILISSASYTFSDYIPGGEHQVAYAIVSGLAKRGHKLHVFTPIEKLKNPLHNVKVYEVTRYDFDKTESYSGYFGNWWKFSLASYMKARQIVREQEIDVIHHIRPAHINKFSLCWNLNVPFIYGPMNLPWTSKNSLTRWKKQNIFEPIVNRFVDRINMTLGNKFWNLTLEKSTKILVMVKQVLDFLPKYCHSYTSVVPSGVDTTVFTPQENLSEPIDILFVGRLQEIKGVEYLIRAMKLVVQKIPDVKLHIIGKGPGESFYKNLTSELGLQNNVIFRGTIPFDKIVEFYQRCRIFCLPSLGDPFPQAILQAMSCGKPVISTNAGGVPEMIEDGKSGFLVPVGNSEALAAVISKLIDNPKLRSKMGAYNRKFCEEKYDWNIIIDGIEKVYLEVIR